MDQFEIALCDELIRHVHHQLPSLSIKDESREAAEFQLVLAVLHCKEGLVDEGKGVVVVRHHSLTQCLLLLYRQLITLIVILTWNLNGEPPPLECFL